MICIGNLRNPYISAISVTKPKNVVVFAFTYVSESSALFYGNFCKNSHSVDSHEALNASSLQFLRSVKCFIAMIFYSALNASSPLLLKENHHLTLHHHYFIKSFIA
jgi:hypothetical protein